MTFTADEMKHVDALCESWSRWLPPATSLRQMILLLAENPGAIQKVGTPGAQRDPQGPTGTQAGPGPDHTQDIAQDTRSSSGKEEEKKSKKKKEKKNGLAPLPVSEEVIGYLNEQAGTSFQPDADAHRKLIQARMNDGATVDDLKTVIRKKCAEWKGGKMQTNLKPSTLFRASNFEGYLGQLEPGKVSYGKKNHVQRMTEAQDQGEWSWDGVE